MSNKDTPYVERTGGSYEKQPDGSLRRLEEPTSGEAPKPAPTEDQGDEHSGKKKGK